MYIYICIRYLQIDKYIYIYIDIDICVYKCIIKCVYIYMYIHGCTEATKICRHVRRCKQMLSHR